DVIARTRDREIEFAISIEIGNRHAPGIRSGGKILFGSKTETGGARGGGIEQNRYRARATVRDCHIGPAVIIEITDREIKRPSPGTEVLFSRKARRDGASISAANQGYQRSDRYKQ